MSARVRRVPRWVAVAVPLILCAGTLACVALYWPWITRPRIGAPARPLPAALGNTLSATDARDRADGFVGHTRDDIAARFGAPAERLDGHYGLPPVGLLRTYPEAHSWAYAVPGGRLYLSFCRQRGKWVCFRADPLPDGASF